MTDLDSGAERQPKPTKPRSKKAPGTAVKAATKLTEPGAAPRRAPQPPAARSQPRSTSARSKSAQHKPGGAKSSAAQAIRHGPELTDWLSLAVIVAMVLLAAGLYQWRGERAGPQTSAPSPPAAQSSAFQVPAGRPPPAVPA